MTYTTSIGCRFIDTDGRTYGTLCLNNEDGKTVAFATVEGGKVVRSMAASSVYPREFLALVNEAIETFKD